MVIGLLSGAALMALGVWLMSRRRRCASSERDSSDATFLPLYAASDSGSGGRKSDHNDHRAEPNEGNGDSSGDGGGGDGGGGGGGGD